MASRSSCGTQLSSRELDDLVNHTVLYILSQDHTKYPIKRQDIVKNVLESHGRQYKLIMSKAAQALKEVSCMFVLSFKE
jgi:hypothetical protein